MAALLSVASVAMAVVLFGPAAFLPKTADGIDLSAYSDAAISRMAARDAIRDGEFERAALLAKRALEAAPLDAFALVTASLAQDEANSVEAMNVAAALGWRDPVANEALFAAAIDTQNAQIAAQRLDALGRARPEVGRGADLDRVLALRDGLTAMERRLARHGSLGWWEQALHQPPVDTEALERRIALLRSMPIEDGMAQRSLLERLVLGLPDPMQGWGAWRTIYGEGADFAGFVFDPEMKTITSGKLPIGGEWRRSRDAVGIIESPSQGSGALISVAPGQSGTVLSQVLRVEPGPATLAAEGNADGLAWSLSCGPNPIELNGLRQTNKGAGDWAVTIPVNCSLARLELQARGTRTETIKARIDRVSLEPAE